MCNFKKKNKKEGKNRNIRNQNTYRNKRKTLNRKEEGITLIALVTTILFSYDEKLKCSNNKGFLLQTI